MGNGLLAYLVARTINDILAKLIPSNSVELIPKYNIWGSFYLNATNSDDQCTADLINGGCKVQTGYDSKTCTRINNKCYSNTTTQCQKDNDCKFNFLKIGRAHV